MLSQHAIHVRTLPNFEDLASADISISDVKELDVLDLLGRATVKPIPELFNKNLGSKVVMIS